MCVFLCLCDNVPVEIMLSVKIECVQWNMGMWFFYCFLWKSNSYFRWLSGVFKELCPSLFAVQMQQYGFTLALVVNYSESCQNLFKRVFTKKGLWSWIPRVHQVSDILLDCNFHFAQSLHSIISSGCCRVLLKTIRTPLRIE